MIAVEEKKRDKEEYISIWNIGIMIRTTNTTVTMHLVPVVDAVDGVTVIFSGIIAAISWIVRCIVFVVVLFC